MAAFAILATFHLLVALANYCFVHLVIYCLPKIPFQVLVRHSFKSSRLAELSVVKGEVGKNFSFDAHNDYVSMHNL